MYKKIFNRFHSQIDLPFQETKQVYLEEIFKILEKEFDLQKNSKQFFLDLGSGTGHVVIYSAINYGIRSVGIEIDPILIKEAEKTIRFLRRNKISKIKGLHKITLLHGDFYTHNLKNYNFIYIYSLPTMQKYLKHVFQTAKGGAIVISHVYPLESLTKYLEFKLKLEHKNDNQEISTFFYRRI
ncbi:MAG: class I SAM-dependent methyltransferase [Candidatus Thorarchaeota archaeon]